MHHKWHPIPYIVHYFSPEPYGSWSKVQHYIGDKVQGLHGEYEGGTDDAEDRRDNDRWRRKINKDVDRCAQRGSNGERVWDPGGRPDRR